MNPGNIDATTNVELSLAKICRHIQILVKTGKR
jgi:hypothetical protein